MLPWAKLVLEYLGIQENEYFELLVGSHDARRVDLRKMRSWDTDDGYVRLLSLSAGHGLFVLLIVVTVDRIC